MVPLGIILISLFKVCLASTLVLQLFTNSKSAWEGVLGGIIINGPTTANYDEDAGVLFLNDWSHQTADALYQSAQTRGPPTLDNGLINGTNVYGDLGSRFETAFMSGTSYRIRLVNAAIDTMFKFMIDGHTMTVVATDLVPIVPYKTTVLSIGIGQRYDIIVTADQSTADYWLRAIPQTSCSDVDNADNVKGIVRYDSTSTSDPTSSAYDYTDSCNDEAMANLVPFVSIDASTAGVTDDFAVSVGRSGNVFKWFMAGTTFVVRLPSLPFHF
jgi:FtsP/CotA-like multicopper oxidase with cupredoxin domain